MDEVAISGYSQALYIGGLEANLIGMPGIDPDNFTMPYLPTCFEVDSPNEDWSLGASSWSSSASDEVQEKQQQIDERKRRRMVSNRESARRSRMRKQKLLDELWSQVVLLRSENCELIERLNTLSDQCEQIIMENRSLRKQTTVLKQKLGEIKLNPEELLRVHEEIPCIADPLVQEQKTTNKLLHTI